VLRGDVVDVLVVVGILSLVVHCVLAILFIFTPNDLNPLFRSRLFLLLFLYIDRSVSLGRNNWGLA